MRVDVEQEPGMPGLALSAERGWPPTFRRAGMIGFAAVLAVFALSHVAVEAGVPAQSKDRHAQRPADAHFGRRHNPPRPLHDPDYQPPYADIVVDDNSGRILHETNPDSPRHPASLTKIMTLYLLFEQLQAKQLRLNSRLQVSAHAAAQAPTKLGLKANETITVEDAIKGIITRSANDAAVVIVEAIAGSEREFAA